MSIQILIGELWLMQRMCNKKVNRIFTRTNFLFKLCSILYNAVKFNLKNSKNIFQI